MGWAGAGLFGLGSMLPGALAPSLPKPVPPPIPPTMASGSVQQSMAAQAAAAAAAEGRGFAGTMDSGPEGAPAASTAGQSLKTTLGS